MGSLFGAAVRMLRHRHGALLDENLVGSPFVKGKGLIIPFGRVHAARD
jgi:hypothetical protein